MAGVRATDTDSRDGLLLTGATGFLGAELLARYLEQTDRAVYALVRADSDDAADARLGALLGSLFAEPRRHADRVVAVRADLRRPWAGLVPSQREQLAERVSDVVHCAASVSFEQPLAEAREINVEGSRRMLELAHLCEHRGGLNSFSHVSTAYVAGARHGVFGEGDWARAEGFRNSYERSKAEAEGLVRARSGILPVQIFRPSIVVGDSRTGWTPAFNVIYWPLKAFSRGTYSAVPGRRSAPVDIVPVDYVADAILSLSGRPGEVHHLTAGPRATTLGEIGEMACAYFERPHPRLFPPALYRRLVHPLLLRRASGSRRRVLKRSEAYFPYFDARVRYDNARARAALSPLGVEAPRLHDYFDQLMWFACQSDWGRRAVTRAQAWAGRADSSLTAVA